MPAPHGDSALPAGHAPTSPAVQLQAVPQPQTAAQPINATSPNIAADGELIEEQWIDAVKRAVSVNRGNPFELNASLAALRKKYLGLRYGKGTSAD